MDDGRWLVLGTLGVLGAAGIVRRGSRSTRDLEDVRQAIDVVYRTWWDRSFPHMDEAVRPMDEADRYYRSMVPDAVVIVYREHGLPDSGEFWWDVDRELERMGRPDLYHVSINAAVYAIVREKRRSIRDLPRRGDANEQLRIFLVGGRKKLNQYLIPKIEGLGVRVTGGHGEVRFGRLPTEANTDAILVVRNAVSTRLFNEYRSRAERTGLPLVIASTNLIDIDSALREADLLPGGGANLVQDVQGALSPQLRRPDQGGGSGPMAGHCYVAAEALWHLLGGPQSGLIPAVGPAPDGGTHWWLVQRSTGRVLDPTASQWPDGYDYTSGRNAAFLTTEPSKRAQVVIDRVRRGSRSSPHRHHMKVGPWAARLAAGTEVLDAAIRTGDYDEVVRGLDDVSFWTGRIVCDAFGASECEHATEADFERVAGALLAGQGAVIRAKRWLMAQRRGSVATAATPLIQQAHDQIAAGRGRSAFDKLYQAEILHHAGGGHGDPIESSRLMGGWFDLRRLLPQGG